MIFPLFFNIFAFFSLVTFRLAVPGRIMYNGNPPVSVDAIIFRMFDCIVWAIKWSDNRKPIYWSAVNKNILLHF